MPGKMTIDWIRPHHFRAFGECEPIVFEDGLTIIFGSNGSGKSSLAEATEWLLFGHTSRRRKGDEFSKEEYRGSYARNLQDCQQTPFVEAKIRLAEDICHLVRRNMLIPEDGRFDDTQSELLIDGSPGHFSDLGLSVLPVYNPVVAQHALQDFIHTRPIDRYRAMSDALGLTDLVDFKGTLDSARSAYRNRPPTRVVRAKSQVQGLIGYLEDLGLEDVACRWSDERFCIEDDYADIARVAKSLAAVSEPTTENELILPLSGEQANAMRRVFDLSPFQPRPDSDEFLPQLATFGDALAADAHGLVQAAQSLLSRRLAELEEQRIKFWKAGLDLIEGTGMQVCPFCEQKTLSDELLENRRGQVDRAASGEEAKKELRLAAKRCEDTVSGAFDLIEQLRPRALSPEDEFRLKEVLERDRHELSLFVVACQTFQSTTTQILSQMEAMKTDASGLIATALGDQASELPERAREVVHGFESLTADFSDALNTYSKEFSNFEPVLRQQLADEHEVRKYTAAIALLQNRESVLVCSTNRKLEDDLLERQRAAGDYVMQKQQQALSSREKEMLWWYETLSPEAGTYFSGIEVGTERFVLKAKSFDTELSAPACLSHSQLNCLGLSIWIPRVIDQLSPFGFIVFDDPVQTMDEEHTESFIINVVPDLVEQRGIQVIALTYLKPIAARLRECNYHLNHCCYRFADMTESGSHLCQHYLIKDEIKQIRHLMTGGDEDSRSLAVDRIRVLCEHIIREAHLVENGAPLPDEFLSARASELFKPLNSLKRLNQKQKQAIVTAVKWADPSHHTDKTWQVPSTSNIQPHLNQIENIVKELGIG